MTNDLNLQILRLHLQRARVAVVSFHKEPDAVKSIAKLDMAIGPYWEILARQGTNISTAQLAVIGTQVDQLESSSPNESWHSVSPYLQAALSALPGKHKILIDD